MAGGFGAAALLRMLRRRRADTDAPGAPGGDPAAELRRRLAQAREAPDDRDEFDAAEGVPIDEVDRGGSVEQRRRAIHEQAQEAIEQMRRDDTAVD